VDVYEATSHWDAEKQQPRQTRTYLGKQDPQTGKVIPPRQSRTPRHAKDYGNLYLLQQIAMKLGLPALLHQVFPEDAALLLALAVFEISEAAPFYLFPQWVDTTYISDVKALSSVELTRVTQRLGRMDTERDEFFRRWIAQCAPVQTMVFDITSLSSYSTLLNEVEWGYNRDHDPLPQINLGMVYAEDTQMPLYYQAYPGSIRDVSTLSNMIRYCEAFALIPDLFVMDRGFYSAANVAALTSASMKFLLPLPRSVGLFTDLLAQHYQTLTALPNSFLFQDELLCHVHTTVPLNVKPVIAHIYFDPSRFYAQAQRFLTRLWQAEATLEGRQFNSPEKAQQALSHHVPGAAKFFRWSVTKEQVTTLRDALAVEQHLAPMGITIFLTNHADLDRLHILQIYRQKDVIEKAFDVLKHELDGQRLRGHSTDAITGRLFLKFLSLIIYSALQRTMREQQLFAKYSVRELLYELKKLRVVEMLNGQCLLTEISKRQREIFKAFDIAVPKLKNLVTKT
jgi:transposase